MPIAFLGAQGIHGVVAGRAQVEGPAGLDQGLVDMRRELGRHIELPAQLADIGDTLGADPGVADLDLLARQERKPVIRQIRLADRIQQVA